MHSSFVEQLLCMLFSLPQMSPMGVVTVKHTPYRWHRLRSTDKLGVRRAHRRSSPQPRDLRQGEDGAGKSGQRGGAARASKSHSAGSMTPHWRRAEA